MAVSIMMVLEPFQILSVAVKIEVGVGLSVEGDNGDGVKVNMNIDNIEDNIYVYTNARTDASTYR